MSNMRPRHNQQRGGIYLLALRCRLLPARYLDLCRLCCRDLLWQQGSRLHRLPCRDLLWHPGSRLHHLPRRDLLWQQGSRLYHLPCRDHQPQWIDLGIRLHRQQPPSPPTGKLPSGEQVSQRPPV